MNYQLPPGIPLAFGVVLVVFGVIRAYHLGWKSRLRETEDGKMEPSKAGNRHLRWGLIYVAMGLFLLISTFLRMRTGR
jgi:hypothetical protein